MYNCSVACVQFHPTALFSHMRRGCPTTNGRGVQLRRYIHGWISRMEEAGLVRSMSKKGCSPDNSACEGFFGRLKNEMYYGRSWFGVTVDQFVESLNAYIHWYNEKRIKSSLGGMSPIEYRKSIGWSNCATMPPLLTECRKND